MLHPSEKCSSSKKSTKESYSSKAGLPYLPSTHRGPHLKRSNRFTNGNYRREVGLFQKDLRIVLLTPTHTVDITSVAITLLPSNQALDQRVTQLRLFGIRRNWGCNTALPITIGSGEGLTTTWPCRLGARGRFPSTGAIAPVT